MRRHPARPLLLAAIAIASACASLHAQPALDYLRIIAPAAPGGGWDQTGRVMQQVLQQAGIVRTAPVENIPGAAGTIGLARFIGAEHGRGDAVMVSGLIMLGGIVTNQSPVTLGDVTPIARLTGEYEVLVVPAASPLRSLQDFIAALQRHPEAVSWGGGSAGGSDQILAGLIADAVGVSPSRVNYIAFSGGGESLSAIVGGQVTVGINGLAELEAQIEAGTVRALAISSAERLPGINVPTLREQGVDLEFENWRSVVAPPGISASDRSRLDRAIEAMVHSAQWRDALQRYRWLDRYLAGEPFARFVDGEEARVRDILRKFGTGRRTTSTLTSAGPYPMFVLLGLVVFGCVAVWDLTRSARLRGSAASARQGVFRSSIAWLAAGIIAHLLLAERGGFIVASAALFWFTARAFDPRRPWRDGVFAVAISIAAYVLFARVLQLSLPAGIFAGWL
jgi:putative tricarboxylic transport membrane protein